MAFIGLILIKKWFAHSFLNIIVIFRVYIASYTVNLKVNKKNEKHKQSKYKSDFKHIQ